MPLHAFPRLLFVALILLDLPGVSVFPCRQCCFPHASFPTSRTCLCSYDNFLPSSTFPYSYSFHIRIFTFFRWIWSVSTLPTHLDSYDPFFSLSGLRFDFSDNRLRPHRLSQLWLLTCPCYCWRHCPSGRRYSVPGIKILSTWWYRRSPEDKHPRSPLQTVCQPNLGPSLRNGQCGCWFTFLLSLYECPDSELPRFLPNTSNFATRLNMETSTAHDTWCSLKTDYSSVDEVKVEAQTYIDLNSQLLEDMAESQWQASAEIAQLCSEHEALLRTNN